MKTLVSGTLLGISIFLCNPVLSQFDFGDAPDPAYPTLSINNGASHSISSLYLGNYIDINIDGQPSQNCNGDDNSQIVDDEDGVAFTTWVVPGQTAKVNIVSSGSGFIDAWIDYNGNGNWNDPGDQIFTSQAVLAGVNALSFNVPASATSGVVTVSRFRLSSVGNLLPSGVALDGEVEDYLMWLGTPSGDAVIDADPALTFTQNEISMTFESSSENIIAAYNDNPYPGGPGIGVSHSTDSGQTWTATQLPVPINPYSGTAYLDVFDPAICSDNAGNTFVAHVATDFNWTSGPVSGLYVHKSANGGVSWSAPVAVDTQATASGSTDSNYRFNDRCQIRVDLNVSSSYYNNIYLTWIQDRGWNMSSPFSDIYVSVSSNGGSTFSAAKRVNTSNYDLGNMPVPAIASNGDVYILWVDYNVITGGTGVLLLNKSSDGGTSWSNEIVVDTINLPPIQLNGGTGTRAKGAAVLRSHPTNPSILYAVYAANPGTADESDINFIKSVNGGVTWSDPVTLNDDATQTDQMMPWMEVKSNGIIDIVWYDRRNDATDQNWDVYATTSIDDGANFAANMQVNAMSSPSPNTNGGKWLGEYLGLAVSDNTAFVAYTSANTDQNGDVLFTSFANPVLSNGLLPSPIEQKVMIYPNPSKNQITIEMDGLGDYDIVLRNSLGQEVEVPIVFSDTKAILEVSELSGVYTIEISGVIRDELFVSVRKVIIE